MTEKIQLAQGAGGQLMDTLIKKNILKYFFSEKNCDVGLHMLDDAAILEDIVFSTDSHTVQPLIFPGGDIGKLSVCGTVNDLAVIGATSSALSAGFIVEEGLSIDVFEQIVQSMGQTAQQANVPIITGDTKVVEKGAIQEFMINTSGFGRRNRHLNSNFAEIHRYRKTDSEWLVDSNLRSGDKLIISGNIGEHGIALLSFREGYGFETKIKSDVAPINLLMDEILQIGGVVAAKDPTRGGLANTVNEFSEKSNIGIIVEEERLPIPGGVRSACDFLGLDPLEIGNEGKVVLAVVKEKADEILSVLRKNNLGKHAVLIGEATDTVKDVILKTEVGGKRILHKPLGDPIPRIC